MPAATARASPPRMAVAVVPTQVSAAGSASSWKHQAAFPVAVLYRRCAGSSSARRSWRPIGRRQVGFGHLRKHKSGGAARRGTSPKHPLGFHHSTVTRPPSSSAPTCSRNSQAPPAASRRTQAQLLVIASAGLPRCASGVPPPGPQARRQRAGDRSERPVDVVVLAGYGRLSRAPASSSLRLSIARLIPPMRSSLVRPASADVNGV